MAGRRTDSSRRRTVARRRDCGRYRSPEPAPTLFGAGVVRELIEHGEGLATYSYPGLATCFETCRQIASSEFVRCIGSNRGCDSSGDNTAYCSQIAVERSTSCRENLCKKEPSRHGKPDKYKDEWDEQRGPYPDYTAPQRKKYKFQNPKTLPAARLQ